MNATFKANPTDAASAPRSAFRFAASAKLVETKSDAPEAADGVLLVPVELVVRTADLIDHWYWGPIVHDFAGMKHREKIALDMQHSYGDPVGYADKFTATDEGLVLGGALVALTDREDDEALKLIRRGRAGVPYQGSIDFDPFSVVMEYVSEGMTSEANGRTYEGPLVIARQWELLGAAVCLHGIDGGTEARFSRGAEAEAPVRVTWKGKFAMSKEADKPAAPAVPETPPTDSAGKFAAELKAERERYVGRFGKEHGIEYLAAGMGYVEALETHVGKLSKDLEGAQAAKVNAEEKLKASQLAHGEPGAISTAAPAGAAAGAKGGAGLLSMVKQRK